MVQWYTKHFIAKNPTPRFFILLYTSILQIISNDFRHGYHSKNGKKRPKNIVFCLKNMQKMVVFVQNRSKMWLFNTKNASKTVVFEAFFKNVVHFGTVQNCKNIPAAIYFSPANPNIFVPNRHFHLF